jgi:L-alanine-DL-glutamate epimerase-like enolase superfamily enzyme
VPAAFSVQPSIGRRGRPTPTKASTTVSGAVIDDVRIAAYEVPTDHPESDGTLKWDSTTCVIVEITAGNATGHGYPYSDVATARLIDSKLASIVKGQDAFATAALSIASRHELRNLGDVGLGAMAVSALDVALWDLRARLLKTSLVRLLGMVRKEVPIYGSGGFTSYSVEHLREQLGGWVEEGIPRVKMKIGREPDADLSRVKAARDAIGPNAELFVDANGAYARKQAMQQAVAFPEYGVSWFEEPVSKYDHVGLRLLRDRAPARMEITVGEYGWSPHELRRLIEEQTVDVLQADVTRCGGITGFMAAAALCEASFIPLSSHCAPAISMHAGAAAPSLRHIEYFYDHIRIERMFFDGVPPPVRGSLRPDPDRPGHGLELKRSDADKYVVWRSDR